MNKLIICCFSVALSISMSIPVWAVNPPGTDILRNAGECALGDKLLTAVTEGNLEEVKELIDRHANVNVTERGGMTPLHYAALFGHTEIVRLLLNQGADANANAVQGGNTPLHLAGDEEVIHLLLMHGANREIKNQDGKTPFVLAHEIGDIKVARFISNWTPPQFR